VNRAENVRVGFINFTRQKATLEFANVTQLTDLVGRIAQTRKSLKISPADGEE